MPLPETALQKVASDLKLLLGQLPQPPLPTSPELPSEIPTALAANTPTSLPVATKTGQEQTAPSGVVTNLLRSENLPALEDRSGLTQRLAALETLLNHMKAPPDRLLQKLSTEVAVLLQIVKPEHVLTQGNTACELAEAGWFVGPPGPTARS